MIRVGENDKLVYPYYSRRMYRLIREHGDNVVYSEIPNKEEWWYDTDHSNDGGTMNDPTVRGFAIKHSKSAKRRRSTAGLLSFYS